MSPLTCIVGRCISIVGRYPANRQILQNFLTHKSCSFHPFLFWIKEKSMATIAIRNICDKTQNQKSDLPPYYRTGDSVGEH